MYTDETLLTWGRHKFTKLCRVPADYLLRLNENSHSDKELTEYIEKNRDKLIARMEGRIESPSFELDIKISGNKVQVICPDSNKIIFISEKEAKAEINRIRNLEQENKKPSRVYECVKCGGWHLTSMLIENYEKTLK